MTGRGDISDDDVAALVGLMADAASAFIPRGHADVRGAHEAWG